MYSVEIWKDSESRERTHPVYLPLLRTLTLLSRFDLSNLQSEHSAPCRPQFPNPGSNYYLSGIPLPENGGFHGSHISWPDENWIRNLWSAWYHMGLFLGLFTPRLSPRASSDEREWEWEQESKTAREKKQSNALYSQSWKWHITPSAIFSWPQRQTPVHCRRGLYKGVYTKRRESLGSHLEAC